MGVQTKNNRTAGGAHILSLGTIPYIPPYRIVPYHHRNASTSFYPHRMYIIDNKNMSSNEPNVASSGSHAAPKRDKFAALASSRSRHADTTSTTVTPKRDKFAAMGQRQSEAVVLGTAVVASSDDTTAEATKLAEWQTRQHQRQAVWKDLDQAESLVLDLLEQAQKTANVLAQQTCGGGGGGNANTNNDDDDDGNAEETAVQDKMETDSSNHDDADDDKLLLDTTRQLAQLYRDTLTTIHGKLAPHAKFVQNYKAPERGNRLYEARMEEGLARQKKELLASMLQFEQSEMKEAADLATEDANSETAKATEPASKSTPTRRKRRRG